MLAPVSLVVAVQCSGISAAVLAKINRVGGMIQPLVSGDRGRVAVIAYDDEVRVLQEFHWRFHQVSASPSSASSRA